MKFGGSSISDPSRIRNVAQIIKSHSADNLIIVLSAFGGVTDSLINAANSSVESGSGSSKAEAIIERHINVIHELKLKPEIIAKEVSTLRQQMHELDSTKQLSPQVLDSIMSFGERMSVRIFASYLSSIGLDAKAYDAFDIGIVTDSNFSSADVLPETYTNICAKLKGISTIPIITGFIGKDKAGNITTLGREGVIIPHR